MTHLRGLGWRQVERALLNCGFQYAPKRGKGSHRAYFRTDENQRTWMAVVPMLRDIPMGTLNAIVKQSGLTIQKFMDCLEK